MKERISGYFETKREIDYLIYKLSLDCRILLSLIRNSRAVLKECNQVGSMFDACLSLEQFKADTARVQQRITRHTNKARRLFSDFVEGNEQR